ncbi:MAG: gliding motility-associated C-terminal domain-containing protein [Chitinophagaceae bacterium]|nr:gliding motility-associated C-terminal domain-containing protein [Chitinophagaceae bacterium]
MKNTNPTLALLWTICMLQMSAISLAQLPAKQWSRKYGGSAVDIPYSIKCTSDGGTIVAGYTESKNGDVSRQPSRDYWDLWLLKLDRCGNRQWERSFGGTGYESARDVEQTADGGFIVLGETNSTDGGVIAGYGGTKDIWLLKLNGDGNVSWQKRYGGNGLDIGNHIRILDNGNYLIAASSSSNDGDITGNHGTGGYTDGVLLEINAAGAMVWSKCYGGSKNDELLDLEIIDGRLYVAGYANSTDGDIPPSQKNYDVWLLALDSKGNKIYSKVYGGSQNDVAYAMSRGNDNSLTLAGYTTSSDGDVSGARGSQDFWVVNINTAGTLKWQKVLGGSEPDYAATILTDSDGGYLVGGISYSSDGDISNALGNGDYWLVKLDAAGNASWEKNMGGGRNDNLRSIAYQPRLKEYYLAGDSESGGGDFTGGRGEADFAVTKLKNPELIVKDSTVCNPAEFAAAPVTFVDVCGYDSAIISFKAVPLTQPFAGMNRSDTIFEGGSLQLSNTANGNIVWNSDPTLSCSKCEEPIASPKVTTVYTATNSIDNCSTYDQFTLVVLKDAVVHIPNAFTPNGDGKNDLFGPLGKVPEGFQMQIFNRYGQLVFRSTSIDDRWNGKRNGEVQPNGTFVYIITYKNIFNQLQQRKGAFVLVR